MTDRDRLALTETKERLGEEQGWLCYVCEKPIKLDTCHFAHILPQDKVHMRRYGKDVIHHRLNGRLTCGLKCNAKVQINYVGHPVAADEQAERILQAIYEETRDARD